MTLRISHTEDPQISGITTQNSFATLTSWCPKFQHTYNTGTFINNAWDLRGYPDVAFSIIRSSTPMIYSHIRPKISRQKSVQPWKQTYIMSHNINCKASSEEISRGSYRWTALELLTCICLIDGCLCGEKSRDSDT